MVFNVVVLLLFSFRFGEHVKTVSAKPAAREMQKEVSRTLGHYPQPRRLSQQKPVHILVQGLHKEKHIVKVNRANQQHK